MQLVPMLGNKFNVKYIFWLVLTVVGAFRQVLREIKVKLKITVVLEFQMQHFVLEISIQL